MISCVETGGIYEYRGLSTDTKPEKASNGSVFFCIDTGDVYMYDATYGVWRIL